MKISQLKYSCVSFSKQNKYFMLWGCQIVLAVIVGRRELSIGTDTFEYARLFDIIQNCQCLRGTHEIGFEWFTLIISWTGFGSTFYFICISVVLFMLINLISNKIIQLNAEKGQKNRIVLSVLILVVFLVSPFFVSAHINAIRQGIAAFFVFYALLSIVDKSWVSFIATGLIAISVHISSVFYLGLFPLLFLPFRKLFFLVAILSVSYAFGFADEQLQWVSETVGLSLYEQVVKFRTDVIYQAGVRYDFLIFTWSGVLFAMCGKWFSDRNENTEVLLTLIKIYLLLIIPFLLFGFANFSNRYAYTAWLFLSILIAYAVQQIILWKSVERYLLPLGVIVAPSLFLLMALNGFAR